MNGLKHTPGPWYSDSEGRIWRRSPSDLYQNGGGVAGDKPLAVANKGWHGDGEMGFPVDDNARLLAAAPKLLEALDRLEVSANTVSFCYDRNPGNFAAALQQLQEDAKLARAEIAKATGGAA